MYPAGHSRDCPRIIGWWLVRARKFGLTCFLIGVQPDRFLYNGTADYGTGVSPFGEGDALDCSLPDSIKVDRTAPFGTGFAPREPA